MTTDPSHPEYDAAARDAIIDLCPFYDPHHKCGIVREKVFKECLTELRERNRVTLEAIRNSGIELLPWQERIIEGLLSGRRIRI